LLVVCFQNALNPSQLLISRLDNLKGLGASLTTATNQPTLTTNVVDKGLTGAAFNINPADPRFPQVPLPQPAPGNPLNQGSAFLTTTGVSSKVEGSGFCCFYSQLNFFKQESCESNTLYVDAPVLD
jgi:hypothetical protein